MSNPQKTILVVEDEKDMRRVLEVRLQGLGYSVITAKDGQEGLAKAKNEKIDLVILDLMLPKIPGEEVCREIRKDEQIGDIPILMLKAKSQDVDKVIGKVIGANCYLSKPFEATVLIDEIQKLLSRENLKE